MGGLENERIGIPDEYFDVQTNGCRKTYANIREIRALVSIDNDDLPLPIVTG